MSKYTCPNCNEPVSMMGHDCRITNNPCDAAARVEVGATAGLILECRGLRKGHTTPHQAFLRSVAGTEIVALWRAK